MVPLLPFIYFHFSSFSHWTRPRHLLRVLKELVLSAPELLFSLAQFYRVTFVIRDVRFSPSLCFFDAAIIPPASSPHMNDVCVCVCVHTHTHTHIYIYIYIYIYRERERERERVMRRITKFRSTMDCIYDGGLIRLQHYNIIL